MCKNVVTVLMLWVFLLGCATTKAYDYAEYHNSLTGSQDMSFCSQYEIAYSVQNKKGKVVTIVSPFLANSNQYLPEKILKFHLGLKVFNPNKRKFKVWVESEFTGLDTDYHLLISNFVNVSQILPEEFISINLPYITNVHSQVNFKMMVISDNKILFESPKAMYRLRGVN